MTLSILGIGLCSPAGARARDHAFFPRAGAPAPAPSAFVLEDGPSAWVGHARFVAPIRSLSDRLLALGRAALAEALAAVPEAERSALRMPLFLSLPEPRPGLDEGALARVALGLAQAMGAVSVERLPGAAGAFLALGRLGEAAARGGFGGAVVLGVDSFFDEESLAARLARPPSPWLPVPIPLAEGAGALFVASPAEARRAGRTSLGEIVGSRSAQGRATDENDEPVDGAAMTSILRSLSGSPPIQRVFGQGRVDLLRSREWEWSVARAAERFHPTYEASCLEAEIGQVGAAAGAMLLAHAIASIRHGVTQVGAPATFAAWAIGQDGMRGLALGSARVAESEDELRALGARVYARETARDEYVPEKRGADEEPAFDEAAFDIEGALAPANDIGPMEEPLPEGMAKAKLVRLDPARLRPVSLAEFYAEVVAHCAEAAAMLGRDRIVLPRQSVEDAEQRLRCQLDAIVAAGARALVDLVAWWEEDLEDPWRSFGGAIGAASFAGADAMAAIAHVVGRLPDEAEEHARTIAEALRLSDHAGTGSLAKQWLGSPRAIEKALGISLLASQGALDAAEARAAFGFSSPVVQRAAIRACERMPHAARQGSLAGLRALLRGAVPEVAWPAARLLALWDDAEVVRGIEEGWIFERTGPRAAELLVLAGRPEHGARIEAIASRHARVPGVLSAAGRFGDVRSGGLLVQCLANEELAEEASAALATLFGPVVEDRRALEAGAWRRAIEGMKLAPGTRYRRGKPWSPAAVAAECAAAGFGRVELERRVDELRARMGRPDFVDVTGWWAEAEASVAALLEAARKSKG
ncbi:hypothetical protein [Polyangium aurulentum]|uniref:hypothetical protein n=1 Tax=Polyangium aurulentum TaxID=2567896 RepID=UPI0010AE1356|nr:hypothetical protein [Polyangium aurulentum]UQA58486.1 hypothetical protein E8A73_045795 [Polyangium aurulentum]